MECRKIVASLMAVGLLVLISVSAGHLAVPSPDVSAQEPVKPQAGAARLKELLHERAATTRKLADQAMLRVKTAPGTVDELLEPTRLAYEAALEACESDKDRVKVMETFLLAAKENERLAAQVFKSGQGREATVLYAQAERLRIDIALERAKTGKREPKPGDKAPAEKKKAGAKNVCIQAGSVEAFESVRVFSAVPGVLKTQNVDIGDRVRKGQVLAVLHAPEIQAQAEQDAVAFDQARARVNQAKAKVRIAVADLDTAKAVVKQAEAAAKGAAATVHFHESQWKRLKNLYDQKSIDEAVLNEGKHKYDGAIEADHAAKAAIEAVKSRMTASASKVDQL